jgi:hypothetical protein
MLRTGGDRGRRRALPIGRAGAQALRRLPALYVAALAWAVTTVAADVIPVGLIARVLFVLGVVIALYAATAAFVVFLACGRWGIVRRASWRRRGGALAITSSFAWILASAWHEGRTTLNLVAIAAAQLAGVALYLGRRSALAAARGCLRIKQ